MASPPNYKMSPPAPQSLALPRQRPALSLPTGNTMRRKTSITSATSSSHPLRQTSFPPPDRYGSPGGADSNAMYSPTDSGGISDGELATEISGAIEQGEGTKKRKRGEKRARGRPPKAPNLRQGSQSLINGTDDGKPGRGAGRGDSAAVGEDVDEDEDEDDEDGLAGDRGGAYEQDRLIQNDRARIDLHQQMPAFQQDRYDSWHRAKLKTADVRRLVNQTLSQSVPANVVTVVQAYAKMFAGILIEEAREVQSEWMTVQPQRADKTPNAAYELLKKHEHRSRSTASNGDELSNGHSHETLEQQEEIGVQMSEAMGLRRVIAESDRGPLLPDHLRESARRYKKSRYGGVVGYTGLSLEGRDVAAVRTGGRPLFR